MSNHLRNARTNELHWYPSKSIMYLYIYLSLSLSLSLSDLKIIKPASILYPPKKKIKQNKVTPVFTTRSVVPRPLIFTPDSWALRKPQVGWFTACENSWHWNQKKHSNLKKKSYHQEFQVPKMEVLKLIRLLWGWVFPYISLTYSFYRWVPPF